MQNDMLIENPMVMDNNAYERSYCGIPYSQHKSIYSLIGGLKRKMDEFELSRRTADVEPRDMQDYPINNVKEDER